jgi:hypothetical protein
VDDEIHNLLVKPLPQGARLTAIFDCCHSGSAMDLPYMYSVDGKEEITFQDNTKEILAQGLATGMALLSKRPMAALASASQMISLMGQKHDKNAVEKSKREKTSPAHVVQFSGCMDSQTSADAMIGGQATGAMSWALITALNQNKNRTYTDLLRELRRLLHGKYKQVPQMTTSHPWNVAQDYFSII